MSVNSLEFAERLAAGARAKASEVRSPSSRDATDTAQYPTRALRGLETSRVIRPTMTIIAGANGAGKSTLISGNPAVFASIPVLDPDVLSRALPSSANELSSVAASRRVLQLAQEHIRERKSLAVETTLSDQNYLDLMHYARGIGRGFEVTLIYIGIESVEINLARIAQRVDAGGHNVSEPDVRRRYLHSLEHLPNATKRADHVLLFDNSAEQGYQLAGIVSRAKSEWFSQLPQWALRVKAQLS